MTISDSVLLTLVRFGIGTQIEPHLPEKVNWKKTIDIAFQQNVPSIVSDGLLTLCEVAENYGTEGAAVLKVVDELKAPQLKKTKTRLYQEPMFCEQDNEKLNRQTTETLEYFRNNGFNCCILKGQGIGQLYDRPDHRATGDIDIWLDGGREKVFSFAKSIDPKGMLHGVNYHHIHFHLFDDTLIEGHIYPSWLTNPFLNKRWSAFSELHKPDNSADTPSLAFNRVYILLHIFHHYSGHGISLKQMLDYHYVLRQGFTETEREETVAWLRKLKLHKFAKAMMWFQQQELGLPEEYLLVEPDEKEGKHLFDEVLKPNTKIENTALRRFFSNLRRNAQVAVHYPSLVIWDPLFSIWLYFWRLFHGYLKDREKENTK